MQGCHTVNKSGKTYKNDKSQVEIGVFEKSQEFFFLKHQILSVQTYKIHYIQKYSMGKKIIINSLKSD